MFEQLESWESSRATLVLGEQKMVGQRCCKLLSAFYYKYLYSFAAIINVVYS